MSEHEFTFICPFGGSGGGALGVQRAEVRVLGHVGRWRCLGSVDSDEGACRDFVRLVGSPAHCADIERITASDLRAWFGARAPHLVLLSPPCKGSSRLLSAKKARTAPYRRMNRLACVWMERMLEAWPDPPAFVLLENVPGLPQRARAMLRSVRSLLRSAGYVFTDGTHDCGELGGLAQHRQRYLLVARLPRKVPSLLYQPPKRRVRACGEVLSQVAMPATIEAREWGALHTMPRIEWRNWLRLALIPAGGDWRDLPGVLADEQARREVHRRHSVERWDGPTPAITGPGGHAVGAVADPRAFEIAPAHNGAYGVRPWDTPSGVVTGAADSPSSGRFAVADPRALEGNDAWHRNKHSVTQWGRPAPTVIGKPQPSSGGVAIADPRLANLEVSAAYDAGYGVLRPDQPARTVPATVAVGTGAHAIADDRPRVTLDEALPARVMTLDEALDLDWPVTKPPPCVPVIIARDGTWHRPLTLLELALLQGYPLEVRGERLAFGGTRTEVAEHIGNSIPPPAAEPIGEQTAIALIEAELGMSSLRAGAVWVEPDLATTNDLEDAWSS